MGVSGRLSETLIVISDVGGRKRIRGFNGRYPLEPELLHKCARSTRPLAAGVFAQIRSMLSSKSARPNCVWPSPPVATRRRSFICAENTRLIAVERQRLSMLLDIPTKAHI